MVRSIFCVLDNLALESSCIIDFYIPIAKNHVFLVVPLLYLGNDGACTAYQTTGSDCA